MKATVDVKRVAETLNLDIRRIQQLVKEGLPRAKRGRYDERKCSRWYIRYLQNALEKRGVAKGSGKYAEERDERVRLIRADADLREIELARERGQLIALPDYERTLADLILTTKARILAIPPRVAAELVGETSRVMIQAKLEKACKDALAYLARERDDGNRDSRDRATGSDTP